ncbi:hypothetical protein Tco_0682351 [Tanacetum coccineum]|uniref:Uncharacterized protein n=1 Tax=Tanacetum coccineum TaxID=301880 RepID=A0ABQ4XSF5_9ASTR
MKDSAKSLSSVWVQSVRSFYIHEISWLCSFDVLLFVMMDPRQLVVVHDLNVGEIGIVGEIVNRGKLGIVGDIGIHGKLGFV